MNKMYNLVMEGCIFCRIAKGEIPSQKVWEDENYLAFLDIHPEAEGHTLIIPKKHYSTVWVVEDYCGYMEKVREVVKLLQTRYNTNTIIMKVIGTDVPHSHIHLIPRK